jgi:Uma2 family endonuclease
MNAMQVVLDPAFSQDWLINLSSRRRLTRADFRVFCEANPDFRVELSPEGELIVMAPVYSRGSAQNAALALQVGAWALRDGTGVAFDATGGFDLPDGSNRSPDASWVLKSRIQALRPEQREGFLELCPDFVVELRSPSDRLPMLRAKMQEYMTCGAKLGWLIDPLKRRVWVYRPGMEVEKLDEPLTLTAGDLMPGFVLDLVPIWNPQV